MQQVSKIKKKWPNYNLITWNAFDFINYIAIKRMVWSGTESFFSVSRAYVLSVQKPWRTSFPSDWMEKLKLLNWWRKFWRWQYDSILRLFFESSWWNDQVNMWLVRHPYSGNSGLNRGNIWSSDWFSMPSTEVFRCSNKTFFFWVGISPLKIIRGINIEPDNGINIEPSCHRLIIRACHCRW